jgi:hypothetical protein
VNTGGPSPENKDPLKDFGRRSADTEGIAGLYIPQGFASELTIDVMPAAKIVASDDGTIGFQAEGPWGSKILESQSTCPVVG